MWVRGNRKKKKKFFFRENYFETPASPPTPPLPLLPPPLSIPTPFLRLPLPLPPLSFPLLLIPIEASRMKLRSGLTKKKKKKRKQQEKNLLFVTSSLPSFSFPFPLSLFIPFLPSFSAFPPVTSIRILWQRIKKWKGNRQNAANWRSVENVWKISITVKKKKKYVKTAWLRLIVGPSESNWKKEKKKVKKGPGKFHDLSSNDKSGILLQRTIGRDKWISSIDRVLEFPIESWHPVDSTL